MNGAGDVGGDAGRWKHVDSIYKRYQHLRTALPSAPPGPQMIEQNNIEIFPSFSRTNDRVNWESLSHKMLFVRPSHSSYLASGNDRNNKKQRKTTSPLPEPPPLKGSCVTWGVMDQRTPGAEASH